MKVMIIMYCSPSMFFLHCAYIKYSYIYFVKCLSNLINSWRFYKSNFNWNEFIFVYMLSIVFVEIFNDNKIFCNSRFIESFFKIYYGQFFYQRLCFLLSNYILHTCTILSYFLFL